MSTNTEKTTIYTGIVAKVMAILGLDEAGKVQKFFKGEIKSMNRLITKLEANKQTNKINFDEAVSNLQEEVEDATEAIENAYTNIQIERISDNASMKSFGKRYWSRISEAESNLKDINERLSDIKGENKESIKDIDDQITKWKERIAKIN